MNKIFQSNYSQDDSEELDEAGDRMDVLNRNGRLPADYRSPPGPKDAKLASKADPDSQLHFQLQGSLDNSRKTEKIDFKADLDKSKGKKFGETKSSTYSRDDENLSHSLKSFTNPKIRQTITQYENQLHQPHKKPSAAHQLDSIEARDSPQKEADSKHRIVEYNQQYEDSEGEALEQPLLHPTQTFGNAHHTGDEEKDKNGVKLGSYQEWTKERLKQMLPDKNHVYSTAGFVITGPAPLQPPKQPVSTAQKKKSASSSKRQNSNKDIASDPAPLIGISLKPHKSKPPAAALPASSNTASQQQSQHKERFSLKQKDFVSYQSTESDQAPILHQTESNHRIVSLSNNSIEDRNLRQTAEFVNPQFHTVQDLPASNKPTKKSNRSSFRPEASKGYSDIEMMRKLQRLSRETKSVYSVQSKDSNEVDRAESNTKLSQNKMYSPLTSAELNKLSNMNGNISFSRLSNSSKLTIDKLYRHAFQKQIIQYLSLTQNRDQARARQGQTPRRDEGVHLQADHQQEVQTHAHQLRLQLQLL